MIIRTLGQDDLPAIMELWNESVHSGEVVYKPMTQERFHSKFELNPDYDPSLSLVAVMDGRVVGFISGLAKKVFLPGETNENTPGYITCFFVGKPWRGRGIGHELTGALTACMRQAGKRSLALCNDNPLNIDWTIPGTPGHDHNNAPGVDMDCPGYGFLQSLGFKETAREIAMYLDLKHYIPWEGMREKQQELERAGIRTGRFDPTLRYDYDRMCDRVGSEYWREVIRSETECHLKGQPNTDIRFLPDGRVPSGPRVMLGATYDRYLVGFTGPVDKQASGRGWFCGIFTDPQFEHRGIASVLFNLLMQAFIEEGATFSTLFTGESNHAQRIYRRAGFEAVRRFAQMSKTIE